MKRAPWIRFATFVPCLALAACAAAPLDDAALPDVPEGKGDGTVKVQPIQINDTHDVLGAHTIAYTGHPRYTGAWFMAKRGDLLMANSFIAQEITPVIVITDENLTVLDKIVGTTLTGAPNTSEAFVQFPIPADGKYWLLFGEAHRTPRDIQTGATLLVPAGHACHSADECMSSRCEGGTCLLTKPGAGNQLCVNDSDCTTGKCNESLACAFASLGDPCEDGPDCSSTVCSTDHKCTCLEAGHVISPSANPVVCCSQGAVADAAGDMRCR
jgi:hypothetical protein